MRYDFMSTNYKKCYVQIHEVVLIRFIIYSDLIRETPCAEQHMHYRAKLATKIFSARFSTYYKIDDISWKD